MQEAGDSGTCQRAMGILSGDWSSRKESILRLWSTICTVIRCTTKRQTLAMNVQNVFWTHFSHHPCPALSTWDLLIVSDRGKNNLDYSDSSLQRTQGGATTQAKRRVTGTRWGVCKGCSSRQKCPHAETGRARVFLASGSWTVAIGTFGAALINWGSNFAVIVWHSSWTNVNFEAQKAKKQEKKE